MRTIWPEDFYKQARPASLDPEKQKIVDKVMKLLALAEGTNHNEEAQVAQKMATELMARHNIKLSQQPGNTIMKHTEIFNSKQPGWRITLYNGVADFCGVKLYTQRKWHGTNIVYVGTYANITSFQYMLGYIMEQLDRDLSKYMGSSKPNQFKLGFAYGVLVKIHKLISARDQKIHDWGLVPVDEAKQAANWFETMTKVSKRNAAEGQWSQAGFIAGTQVNLHHGVEQQKSCPQLT